MGINMKYKFKKQWDTDIAPLFDSEKPFSPYYPTESYVKKYEDVYILSPWGIILDKNFKPLWESANEIIYWCGRAQNFPELLKTSSLRELNGRQQVFQRAKKVIEDLIIEAKSKVTIKQLEHGFNYVYLSHPFKEMVYGHLFDSFLRLYSLRNIDINNKRLIISSPQNISDFKRHLELLGYSDDYIVRDKNLGLIHVPSLYVGELPCPMANITVEAQKWFYKKYIEENENIIIKNGEKLKLYLDRGTVARENKRDFIDSVNISSMLYNDGFINHESFVTLDETLAGFNSASIIIGAHGAAFQNIMFAGPQARIFEFMPENRTVLAFAKLPKKTDDYYLIVANSDESHNLNIPCDFIKQIVETSTLPL